MAGWINWGWGKVSAEEGLVQMRVVRNGERKRDREINLINEPGLWYEIGIGSPNPPSCCATQKGLDYRPRKVEV